MNITFPNKLPFEDSVLKYIDTAPPGAPLYVDQISKDLGIGMKAVTAAIASLERKGIIATEDEPQGGVR